MHGTRPRGLSGAETGRAGQPAARGVCRTEKPFVLDTHRAHATSPKQRMGDGRLRHTHRRTFRGGLRARRSPPPPLSSLKAASGTFLSQLPPFREPFFSTVRSTRSTEVQGSRPRTGVHTCFDSIRILSTPAWLAGDHRDDGDGRSRRRAGGSQPASVASVLYYIVALGRRRVDDRGRQTSELTPEFPQRERFAPCLRRGHERCGYGRQRPVGL